MERTTRSAIQLAAAAFAFSCAGEPTAYVPPPPHPPPPPAPANINGLWDWSETTSDGCTNVGAYRFVQDGSTFTGSFEQEGNACSGTAGYDFQGLVTNGIIRATKLIFRSDFFGSICNYAGDVSLSPPSAIIGTLTCKQTTGEWRAHPAGPVAAITVEPSDDKVVLGWTRPFKAFLRGAAGERLFYRSVTWSSDNRTVATVSDSGRVSGVGLGNATVTATSGQAHGPATVTVFPMDSFPIAFDGPGGVYVMAADASMQTGLAEGFLEPSWSPDGTRLALTRADTWFGCSIYTVRADGSQSMRITETYYCDHSPAWSPNGTKIAFASGDLMCFDDCIVRLYVVNADGSNMVALAGSGSGWNTRPSWSPDGSKIAFEGWDRPFAHSDIYVMNADGSGAVNLTNDPGFNTEPAWSRDGVLAFVRNGDIWVMNADGSGATNLTANLGFESNPAWSPDGSKMMFVSAAQNGCWSPDPMCYHLNSDLYVMNRDGSGVQHLPAGEFYVPYRFVRNPVFRPGAGAR